mgnify:CR=1 FL=1
MDAKVTWKENLSFDATANSGFIVPLGTSVEHGGNADGSSPMELVLMALGGCSAMDVVSIMKKKQQDVTAFEIKVHGDRVEAHPRVFNHIEMEYIVTGRNLDASAVNRAVELSVTKFCSVYGMLSKVVDIQHKVTILEP